MHLTRVWIVQNKTTTKSPLFKKKQQNNGKKSYKEVLKKSEEKKMFDVPDSSDNEEDEEEETVFTFNFIFPSLSLSLSLSLSPSLTSSSFLFYLSRKNERKISFEIKEKWKEFQKNFFVWRYFLFVILEKENTRKWKKKTTMPEVWRLGKLCLN